MKDKILAQIELVYWPPIKSREERYLIYFIEPQDDKHIGIVEVAKKYALNLSQTANIKITILN